MLSQNAQRVLEARYLRRDAQRRVSETPEQLFARVAKAIAHAELVLGNACQAALWEEAFHRILVALDFLPNSPTLMNAGTGLGQLSACFVLPVDDTMEGIFDAVKHMALVQRTGGGTGFSFSHLRPKGDVVASTGGEASGPVSFMKIFDCATENIKQGGKRRGANMGVLRVDHPDILAFITAKRDELSLQNFNLSVGVTDAFLEAVRHDLRYPLIDPRRAAAVDHVPARMVFEAIVDAAWHTGDPGLLFLHRINRANPTPHLGSLEATNPCGEIPLLPYESCTLGSINLAHMVSEREGEAVVDWCKLRTTVRTGTLSILADTSASIEPLFALVYRRTHVLEGQTLIDVNPIFMSVLQRYGLNAERIIAEVRDKGRLQDVSGLPEALKRVFVTALEIPVERHLQIQAAFQHYVDNSVSKTINLPQGATPRDVAQAYWRAWELGLKGITVYRYGSKSAQVFELGSVSKPIIMITQQPVIRRSAGSDSKILARPLRLSQGRLRGNQM